MINAKDIKSKLATSNGRADRLAKSDKSSEEKIRELYSVAFSREPRADELNAGKDFLAEPGVDAAGNPIDPQKANQEVFQDLIWALINTKEFLFNH